MEGERTKFLCKQHDHVPAPPHSNLKMENGLQRLSKNISNIAAGLKDATKIHRCCTYMVGHWMCVTFYGKHITNVEKQLVF